MSGHTLSSDDVKRMKPDELMESITYTMGIANVRRFEEELRATLKKHHPNVYRITQLRERAGRLVMRLFGIKIYYYVLHGFERRFMLQVEIFGKPRKCHTFRT